MTKDEALKLALDWYDSGSEVREEFQEMIESILAPMSTTCEVQPEHRKLQVKGEHPAPCARHCEATAFQIVIKNLKAQLAPTSTPCEVQPEQEPVTWMCNAFDGEACEQSNHDECENPIPLYTTPQKREWIGLTDEHIGIVLNDPNIAEVRQGVWLVLPYAYAYAIEAKSKELNK